MKKNTIALLRIGVALIFISHGAIRTYAGTVGGFGEFLGERGFPFGVALAWATTVYEMAGGLLLALNRYTLLVTFGFALHQVMGIILVHLNNGWFVVGHSTGGMEYSFLLLLSLAVIAGHAFKKAASSN
ncbi:MAG: DoxX family protein [Bacteroidetes bacterium]|nr:DoxX family protein [Bacteroidota bacterium]